MVVQDEGRHWTFSGGCSAFCYGGSRRRSPFEYFEQWGEKMEISPILLLAAFAMGFMSAIFALAGVALGGYLVYKTKREPHEGLFRRAPEASAGVAEGEQEEPEEDADLPFGTDTTLARNMKARQAMSTQVSDTGPMFQSGADETLEEDEDEEGRP